MISQATRRRFFNSMSPGFVYKPPTKGFSALLTKDQEGWVEYIPQDVLHAMSYKVTTLTELSEAQLEKLHRQLDRLHAFNCGAAVTFRAQVKDLLKKNIDDFNPGLVVQRIGELLAQHQTDLKEFAGIQHLDLDQLEINDQLLWEAQEQGRTT